MSNSKPSLCSVFHCNLPPRQVPSLWRLGKHHPKPKCQGLDQVSRCLSANFRNAKLFFYKRLKVHPFASVTPAAPELRRICPAGLRSVWVRRAEPVCNPHIGLSQHISERICGSSSHCSAQSLSTARHRRVSQAAGRGERLHKNNPPANSAERR